MAPRDHVEVYFRAVVPDGYQHVAVGPFSAGAFLRATATGIEPLAAQWGMIAPGSKTRRPTSRAILTNNARAETVASRPTYRGAWSVRRCLIPAAWYQEPNSETDKHIPSRMRRVDGAPWALAGIWSEWTNPATCEIVPNYTMLTVNCDGHPLLGRLHKPNPKLPDDAQDKRSVVPLEPDQWPAWLSAPMGEALAMRPASAEYLR
ncbi:MAG: SOS response-associated peptidase [Burkholderiaceae bacterium]|jgi:putative SOS response-associated peptidase YedK|nr:SOS response-associated peptidase [Burkholderiaceae bacterium]